MINCPKCNESKDVVKMGIFGKDSKQRYGCNTCKELGKNPWTFYENQNKIKYVCDDPNCGHVATRKGIIRGKQRLYCKECDKTFYAPKVETNDERLHRLLRDSEIELRQQGLWIDDDKEPIVEQKLTELIPSPEVEEEDENEIAPFDEVVADQQSLIVERPVVRKVEQKSIIEKKPKKEPKKEHIANNIREKKKLEKMNRGE